VVSDQLMAGEAELTEHFENPVLTKSGEERLITWNNVILRDDSGVIIGHLSSGEDITERKKAEEALRESEHRYRLLADNVADVIWTMDLDFRLTYVSPSVSRQRGYQVEEALAQSIEEMLTPASLETAMTVISEAFALEEAGHVDPDRSWTVDLEMTCKDGSTIWTETLARFLYDPDGSPTGILGISRDITERKRAEHALKAEKEFSDSMLNALVDTLFVFDPDTGKALRWNRAFEEISGCSPEEIASRKAPDEWYGEEDLQRAAAAAERTFEEGRVSLEMSLVTKDGTLVPTEYAASLVRDAEGGAQYIIAVGRDINERKRLEEEAMAAEALREADRLKDEILANVSHELRTPLTTIKGHCTAMLRRYDGLTNEERLESLHEISESSDRLTELIDKLMDLSRLESGGLSVDKEFTSIGSLIDKAAEDARRKASGHLFVTQLLQSANLVEVDPRRIRQVLDNLLSNAVNYSSPGTEILVRCESTQREVLVSVQDHGVGIDPDEVDKVFERFYRGAGGSAAVGGVGLGLAICKRIVEAHGGRIWVASAPGEGSSFTFTLPLTVPEE